MRTVLLMLASILPAGYAVASETPVNLVGDPGFEKQPDAGCGTWVGTQNVGKPVFERSKERPHSGQIAAKVTCRTGDVYARWVHQAPDLFARVKRGDRLKLSFWYRASAALGDALVMISQHEPPGYVQYPLKRLKAIRIDIHDGRRTAGAMTIRLEQDASAAVNSDETCGVCFWHENPANAVAPDKSENSGTGADVPGDNKGWLGGRVFGLALKSDGEPCAISDRTLAFPARARHPQRDQGRMMIAPCNAGERRGRVCATRRRWCARCTMPCRGCSPWLAPRVGRKKLSNSGSRCWRACRRSRWGSSGIRART